MQHQVSEVSHIAEKESLNGVGRVACLLRLSCGFPIYFCFFSLPCIFAVTKFNLASTLHCAGIKGSTKPARLFMTRDPQEGDVKDPIVNDDQTKYMSRLAYQLCKLYAP
jgi:hypothetical protein